MKTVYKYALYMGYTTITISGTTPKPVKFGMQHGQPYVWVEHELMGGSTQMEFAIVGTGHSVNLEYTHVDTSFDGDFVWHLYYRRGI